MSGYSQTLVRMISKLNIENKLLETLSDGRLASDNISSQEQLDRYSKRMLNMTIRYLEFITEHGKGVVTDGYEGSEGFYAWQVAGCPGVSNSTLEDILLHHLKGSHHAKKQFFRTWIDSTGKPFPRDC